MTIDIHLSVATMDHLEQLAQIHAESTRRAQPPKETYEALRAGIGNGGELWLVALDGDSVIGFVSATVMTPGTALIENVYVTSRRRGHGVGSRLMTEAFALLGRNRIAAVVTTSPSRLSTEWLTTLGIQFVPEGHSLGIAEGDGRVQVVSPPAPLRSRIGAGFMPSSPKNAIAWGIEGLTGPSSSAVAEAFIAAFDASRGEVRTVLDDLAVSRLLSELGRPDLIHRWLQPEAFGPAGDADA